jgi:hypothetical protein
MKAKVFLVSAILSMFGLGIVTVGASSLTTSVSKTIISNLVNLEALPSVTQDVKAPVITNPDWLQAQINAEAASRRAAGRIVTYSVTTRGTITADLSEFSSLANQTLNDARGWAGMGISFQEVASGGSFSLVLSEASQVPSFNYSVCSSDWSCSVGRYVIINQDRWLGASAAWNAAGGSLRDYRHMVVNHETGHWLGHGHLGCSGAGQMAPVMQQQSIDLQGCSFNPWPLSSELWSSTLGI